MSFEEVFKNLIETHGLKRKTQKYDWDYVEQKIKELKVVTVGMVAELAETKHSQEARQWLERHVAKEFDQKTSKAIDRDGNKFVRFKTTAGNVYYAHVENFEATE